MCDAGRRSRRGSFTSDDYHGNSYDDRYGSCSDAEYKCVALTSLLVDWGESRRAVRSNMHVVFHMGLAKVGEAPLRDTPKSISGRMFRVKPLYTRKRAIVALCGRFRQKYAVR